MSNGAVPEGGFYSGQAKRGVLGKFQTCIAIDLGLAAPYGVISSWPEVAAQTPGIYVNVGGNIDHGHQ